MSFFEIFQPGLRHTREERDRQQTRASEPRHGADGPLGIDLDGGKATIQVPAAADAAGRNSSSGADLSEDESA